MPPSRKRKVVADVVGPRVAVFRDTVSSRWLIHNGTSVRYAAELVLGAAQTVLRATQRAAWEAGDGTSVLHFFVEGVEQPEQPVPLRDSGVPFAFDLSEGQWTANGVRFAVFNGVVRLAADGTMRHYAE